MKQSAQKHIVKKSNQLLVPNFYWTKTFKFRTFNEARELAITLSQYAPHPALAAMGLTEMLLNAVEHGNLGIDYNDKAGFKSHEEWLDEVNRRLTLKENINKFVDVVVESTPSMIKFTITDKGTGFDWEKYNNVDKINRGNKNGRGILIAYELGFDELIYHPPGNKVDCIIYRPSSDLPTVFRHHF